MSALARHAVVLVHGIAGRAGREAFLGFVGGPPLTKDEPGAGEAGLAEEGDRVVSRPGLLPGGAGGSRGALSGAPVEAVTWNHDPETTVLSQQPDAPPLWEGSAVTDFYELRCSGPGRSSERPGGPLGTGLRGGRLAAPGRGRAGVRERAELALADRDSLVDLLEALHVVRDPNGLPGYDRVTVVGHRDGGPVAAAALEDCWQRRRPQPPERPEADHDLDVAVAVQDVADARARLAGRVAAPPAATGADRGRLRRAQSALYRLLRDEPADRRWLVSDLVTLGYPDGGRGRSVPPPAPSPVRWTNAWFRHDPDAGPLAACTGLAVEDVDLGGARFGRPGHPALHWTEATRRADREGSRLSVALLRRLVRRRPTLLLHTTRAPDATGLAALAAAVGQAAGYPTARGAVLADVRLVVGEDPATGTPWPLPLEPLPVPARIALREVRRLLGPGGRATVLLSSDLLPPLQPS